MASLNINLQRLSDARDNIAQAIENKGVIVPNNSGFEDFSELVNNIESNNTDLYGVRCNINSSMTSSVLTRLGKSANFNDPIPALNNSTGSSPFDTIMPWAGIIRETVNGNEMVKIPKFYYAYIPYTNSIFDLYISPNYFTGSFISPAHMDRDDGSGERDYVYISRYFINSSYKSISGSSTKVANLSTLRTGAKQQGTGWYIEDYLLWLTIEMLYLVEFANLLSVSIIGRSYELGYATLGITDNMSYHTGTTASSRINEGGIQYRYIESIYGGFSEWIDGVFVPVSDSSSYNSCYILKNPALYKSTYNVDETITSNTLCAFSYTTGQGGIITSLERYYNGTYSPVFISKGVGTSSPLYSDYVSLTVSNDKTYTRCCIRDYLYGNNSSCRYNSGIFCMNIGSSDRYTYYETTRLMYLP